jgi:hypothetical protein
MARTIEQQRMIWENMYGPTRAAEMIHKAEELLHLQPGRTVESVAAEVDPDDDFDDAASSRPGVG